MKLGKELSQKLVEIPPMYSERFLELVAKMREDMVIRLVQANPEDLVRLQKGVHTLDELVKLYGSAPKENESYKQ